MPMSRSEIEAMVRSLAVLVIDDSAYMRKIVRHLLLNIGVKHVHEAGDGIAGLEAIRTFGPDVVILDWELPLLDGSELVRIVRTPGAFPVPDLPIIMLSAHGERWRVVEAVRLGVSEYLMKPVSAQALFDRLASILLKPRAPRPAAQEPQSVQAARQEPPQATSAVDAPGAPAGPHVPTAQVLV